MSENIIGLIKWIIEYQIELWSQSTAHAIVGIAIFDFLALYALLGTWVFSKKLTTVGIIIVVIFCVTFVSSISSLFDVSLATLASWG